MRIAVAGATGRIGAICVALLEEGGHEVRGLSRSQGIDLVDGAGLDEALAGVGAVIDAVNLPAATAEEAVERFGTTTRNLLAAAEQAGVGHLVLLSILNVDRTEGNAHHAGKREQERLVTSGRIPWTIVRAAQFHDFAEMVAQWTERDGTAWLPPLLVQPVHPREVAEVLVETALGDPARGCIDLAGPEPQDLVDMARRTYTVRGRDVKLVPTWGGMFGPSMAGDALLPSDGARLGRITFEEWLEEQRR